MDNLNLEQAIKVLEKDKEERLQKFNEELIALCQKYNISLTTQIILKALWMNLLFIIVL